MNPSGQLEVSQATGGTPLPLTSNGAALVIASTTAVMGEGEDFFGTGSGRAIFLLSSTGQVSALEFNPSTGQQQMGQVLTNWAASAGTAVVGAGEDYLRTGERDVFFGLGTGQLEMGEFNSSGQADYALTFSNWAVAPTTTVIGAGEDYLGSGERDVFFRFGTGQLVMGEFNSSGQADYALFFTNWAVAPTTTVIGAGEDYLGSGERDVFFRFSTGQLVMGEFNSSGQADYALSFTNWAVDTATTVVGAGQDLMRSGERDVFFRLGTGQLEMGEFNSSAQADYAMLFTNANGSAFTIDSGTRVVGVGLDASHGNLPDVTLQTGSGAVETVDIPQSSPAAPSSASTVSASGASNSSTSTVSQASSLIQAMASFPESSGTPIATPNGQNDPLVLSVFTNPLHHS